MLDGYKRVKYPKLGGLVTCVPPTDVPLGSASVVEDCEFTPKTIRTRGGLQAILQLPGNTPVNGLDMLIRQASSDASTQNLIAFGASGKLYKESVAGSGVMELISDLSATDVYMNMTAAYDRAYMAFSNLVTSGTTTPKQYLQYENQFHLDALSIAPADTTTVRTALLGSPTDTGVPGDVPVGTFYMVVMFVTRSGYISGIEQNAIVQIDSGYADRQLIINYIPTGPSNCVGRILAFTEPGTSSLGPYYYIPESFTIQGLNSMITSTIIEDNTTTKVHFNFTADALRSSTDCTQFFDKMLVPASTGVKFLPSLRRVAYWGNKDEPSTVFMSEPDDPETLFGTQSRINVAENNGERIQTIFEFQAEQYVAKERGGHTLLSNNSFPSTWEVKERWTGVGPSGPRALDVCEEFVCFAHRSGPYIYKGGTPEWIGWEHSGEATESHTPLWARINWTYGHLISVKIDTETKRIFFCVPLDQATVPSTVLMLDYKTGLNVPVAEAPGGELASIDGRRWSIWNIPCNQVVRVERTVAAGGNANEPANNVQSMTQILLASSASDGEINMIASASPTDNGNNIQSRYQFAYIDPGGVCQLGGYDIWMRGGGSLGITQMSDEDEVTEKPAIAIKPGKQKVYTAKTKGQADMWALRIHTVNPGDWWELSEAALWLNQIWPWNK